MDLNGFLEGGGQTGPSRPHWAGAFDVRVYQARRWERVMLEAKYGDLASDSCVLLTYGDLIVGWADDYGTFHKLGTRVYPKQAEAFIAAACELANNI